MPKITHLVNQHIAVEHGQDLEEENGSPVIHEAWTIVLTDRTYGDQIRIKFRKDTRDIIVKDLTGGIVLAGGDLPSV